MLIARFENEGRCMVAEARQLGPGRFEVEVVDAKTQEVRCIRTGFKTADSAAGYAHRSVDLPHFGEWVIVQTFLGSHGQPAVQFFAGIGTGSHAPIWRNAMADAIRYDHKDIAQDVLGRIADRQYSFGYSVLALPARLMKEK